jgi:hypothetical protein
MPKIVKRGPMGGLTINCYMIPAVVLQLVQSWIDVDLLHDEHAMVPPLQGHTCNHLRNTAFGNFDPSRSSGYDLRTQLFLTYPSVLQAPKPGLWALPRALLDPVIDVLWPSSSSRGVGSVQAQ